MGSKPVSPGGKRKALSNDKPSSSKRQKQELRKASSQDSHSHNGDRGSSGGRDAQLKAGTEKSSRWRSKDSSNGNKSGDAVAGNTFERGTNSRESHAKQKQLAQERKAAKPLSEELARTKKLWERLRRKSHVPKDERQQLVDELFDIISGRIKDFVLKHDAVRAVQTALKYSTPQQRKQIARELSGCYAQLAESRYAKFLIGKLLVQNDDEIRDLIIPEFYGKVRKLINHPEASWILDDIYRGAATKQQKACLLREWYGPEFALFATAPGAGDTAVLAEILEKDPNKKSSVMKHLLDMVNALIQKQMTGFTMLHDAMLQYFLNLKVETEEHMEFIALVREDESGDLLKNMAFTKSGARLVCLLLAYSSAKDRKQILRTFKDTFQLMCGDANGHVVILAAYDLIDDTVLTSKTIFPEILGKNDSKQVENIIFCANDLNARTTILYPFTGATKSLFPASHAADLELLEEIHEIRKTTSKKNDETRREELVAAASPQLLAAIAASPRDLVSTSFGCQLVTDILLSATGDKAEALQAIAMTAAGSPGERAEDDDSPALTRPHISYTPFGSKMLKSLIAGGRFDKSEGKVKLVDPPLNFADVLYPCISDHIVSWATGPSSFVPLALLEATDFSHGDQLKQALSKNKKALRRAATEETPEQRAKREGLEAADPHDVAGKKKSGARAERVIGNAGAKLILDKLQG